MSKNLSWQGAKVGNGRPGKKDFSRKTMSLAQWDVSGACNLKCQHCRASELSNDDELSTSMATKLLDQLLDLKVQTLNLSGGEPFLKKGFFDLLDYAKNFPLVTITTNGTLLSDKNTVTKLKKFTNIRISISLDGLKKTHDNLRQVNGTYDKVIKAIDNLTQASIRTSVRYTLTTLNRKETLRVYKEISRFPIESFNLRAVLPAGRASASMMPSSKEYQDTMRQLLSESTETKVPVISGDPILLPIFPELLGSIWEEMGEKVFSEICSGCLAGEEVVYISPQGEVGPCPYLPTTKENFKDTSLVAIINKAQLFRQLNNFRQKLKGGCKGCRYRYLCGGCRAAALSLDGNIFAYDPRCLINADKKGGEINEKNKYFI